MKKLILLFSFVILFTAVVPIAHGQTCINGKTASGLTCVPITTPSGTDSAGTVSGTNTTTCPNGGTIKTNADGSQVCNLGYTPLEPIPGISPVNGSYDLTSPGGFAKFINALFKILISAGALLAVLMLTLGGVQYMTASTVGNKTQGLDRAKAAIYGMLLIAATWLILNTINPHLLNFDFIACSGGGCGTAATASSNNSNNQNSSTIQTPAQAQQFISSLQVNSTNCAAMTEIVNDHDTNPITITKDYFSALREYTYSLYGQNISNSWETLTQERQFLNSCANSNSGAAGI